MRTPLSVLVLIATVLVVAGCGSSSSTTSSTSTGSSSVGSASSTSSDGASPTPVATTTASGKALTTSQLVSQATVVCKHVTNQLIAAKDRVSTEQQIAQVAAQRAVVEQTAVNQLSKLTPPPAIASDWQQMISDRNTLVEDLNKIAAYARANDFKAEKPILASSTGLQEQLLSVARRGGFVVCGKIE